MHRLATSRQIKWLLVLIAACACGDNRAVDQPAQRPVGELVTQLSSEYIARIGQDAIGHSQEARYADGGRLVVVLDRYAPHVRLFTSDGEPLWAGALEGGGPTELKWPQSVAVSDDVVLVFQRGRVSRWRLAADTLAFAEAIPIPAEYLPLGGVPTCDGGWFFYARNDRQFKVSPDSFRLVPRIDYLHSLDISDGVARIHPLWVQERDPAAIRADGHAGVLVSRMDTTLVILHRSSVWGAGEILEFDCGGNLLRSHPERALITGDSLPVLMPRSRALQWTSGVIALRNGLATAQHRYFAAPFYDVKEDHYMTEVFGFVDGKYQGSVAVPGQWQMMDYDTLAGVLMTSTDPVPHFIRVPADALVPGQFRTTAR